MKNSIIEIRGFIIFPIIASLLFGSDHRHYIMLVVFTGLELIRWTKVDAKDVYTKPRCSR